MFDFCGKNTYEYYVAILIKMCNIVEYQVFDSFETLTGYINEEAIVVYFGKKTHRDAFKIEERKGDYSVNEAFMRTYYDKDFMKHGPSSEREIVFIK